MKLHIESSSFYGKRTGVGRYGLSITKALMHLRQKDSFVLFNFKRPGLELSLDTSLPDNAKIKFIKWFPGRIHSLLLRKGIPMPLEIYGLMKSKVLIFPNFISWPSLFHKKRISVIHDISFKYHPQFIQSKNLAYLRKQLPKSLKRSTVIVAVSTSTKNDLVKEYGVSPDKISVIYNAIDHNIFNQKASSNQSQVLNKYNLPEKYILFVGTVEPRKNISGLLKAYSESFPKHNLPLVIVGNKGWNDEEIENSFKQLSSLPIHRLGFVDDPDLATLYASASLFVYPSYYEGFGIPALEAMASGCPVVCSNSSSLPEVVGDAALMVDPDDTKGLVEKIIMVLDDDNLRNSMSEKGLIQAKKFSWEKSAQKLSDLIDKLSSQD
jgi:glycosyltransferase involved in cell wall biosynthesis